MKNYKFAINGNKYSVEVGDLENNAVNVEVNGTPYNVEMDMEIKQEEVDGHVKTGDLSGERGTKRSVIQNGSGCDRKAGVYVFPVKFVRRPKDLDFAHARNGIDLRFDLTGNNVFAALDDNVLDAAGEMQKSVAVQIADVPRVEIAVGIDGLQFPGGAVVSLHDEAVIPKSYFRKR